MEAAPEANFDPHTSSRNPFEEDIDRHGNIVNKLVRMDADRRIWGESGRG